MERRVVELPSDYPALAAMQRLSWDINFPGEPFVESAFRHALERSASAGMCWYTWRTVTVVGWLWLDWRIGSERAHIRHLQVARAYWGRGYGRWLVQDALGMARTRGRVEITLNVTKSNERAMRLYAGNGFVPKQDLGDRLHMRCALEPACSAAVTAGAD